MRLTWDEAKNLANQAKHGVSLEEASLLFEPGVDYLELFDEDHSDAEDRFIAIGPIKRGSCSSSAPKWSKTRCGSSARGGRPSVSEQRTKHSQRTTDD